MRFRDERGSVTAVVAATMSVVVLFALAILEHTWVQHVIRTAQEAADYAAEAGAAVFDAYARVTVDRRQLYRVWVTRCLPYPEYKDESGNPICYEVPETRERWSYPVIVGREEDLLKNWRQLFACTDDPWKGWQCMGPPRVVEPERANRWIEYRPETVTQAEATFRGNWQDRSAARLEQVTVTPVAGNRTVTVTVRVRVSPVALRFLPDRTLTVVGRAQSVLEELQF